MVGQEQTERIDGDDFTTNKKKVNEDGRCLFHIGNNIKGKTSELDDPYTKRVTFKNIKS